MAIKQRSPSPRSAVNDSTPTKTDSMLSLAAVRMNLASSDSTTTLKTTTRRRSSSCRIDFTTRHRNRVVSCCLAVALFMSGQAFQWLICANNTNGIFTWNGDNSSNNNNGVDGGSEQHQQQRLVTTSLRRPVPALLPKQSTSSSSTNKPFDRSHGEQDVVQSDSSSSSSSLTCNFYLAESAVPRGGLGVFTATAIPEGHAAQPFPDICLYVTNASHRLGTEIKSHTWQSFRFGAQFLGGDRIRGQCFGLVTMFNSMDVKEYSSARPAADKTLIHTHGGLDRRKDPGAGAISYFYGASSVTKRDLKPGDELLLWDSSFGADSYEDIGSLSGFNTSTLVDEDDDDSVHYHLDVPPSRSPAWLQKYGMCMDHIKIGPATDPAMGRGAFANRFLPQGTVVAPAPLQIFYNRTVFQPPQHDDDGEEAPLPEELIVNYCFQPKGSTMLLFPYGAGVGAINHSRDPSKINVKLRWSNHPMSHTSWLDDEMSIRQFQKVQYPGSLIIEYVATRNIAENEEIFIDYGSEWDDAWNAHVEQFAARDHNTDELVDYQYPADVDRSKPFRTVEEQVKEPYASNLKTVCDTMNAKRKDLSGKKPVIWERGGEFWPEKLTPCYILKRRTVIQDDGNNDENRTSTTNDPYLYAVEWPYRLEDQNGTSKKVWITEVGVPHSKIGFVDMEYQSDQHLPYAFRHPMEFPAEMTPPSWLLQNQLSFF